MSTTEGGAVEPWFARRESVQALLYRVNRRPPAQATLFEQPDDVFDHIAEVLLFGEPVETGNRYKRTWLLGNREIDERNRTLSGHIGFRGSAQHEADRYDDEAREWVSEVESGANTGRAPFIFDADTRELAVLLAPAFSEKVIPRVFNDLLARGEAARGGSTDWDVEPLLDVTDFFAWLRGAESVRSVAFVAKLPNPSGSGEFDPVWTRLEERRARTIKESMEARDGQGLVGIENDVTARAYIAMASNGYGYLKGKRRVNGRDQTYDQRKQVRKRPIFPVPRTWNEARERLTYLVRGQDHEDEGDG